MSLSLLNVDDEEIIGAIQAKYMYHIKFADKYKSMLDAYNGDTQTNPIIDQVTNNELHPPRVRQINNQNERKKQTFESTIVEIFSDGNPRLVTELIKEYFSKTGKEIKTKDFSSKLSIRSSAPGGRVKNAKFIDFPIEKRFWWGLNDWFDGNIMKPEYILKVHEKYNSM